MKFRKVMSALLAGAMVLSVSSTAFASTTNITTVDGMTEGQLIEVTGTTKTADIKITVPTSASIILNPYELEVTTGVDDQVISAVQAIKNESELPVKVTTTVTGTIEGATFADASAVSATDKKVFLEFGVEAIADVADGGTPTLTAAATKKTLSTTAVTFDPVTLTKKGGNTSSMAFGFTGDASKNPDSAWTAEDIVGATIAFTFALDNSGNAGGGGTTPAWPSDVTITIDKSTTTIAASGTDTLTVSIDPSSANAGSLTIQSVAWASGNTSYATVPAAGDGGNGATATVTNVATGSTNITATVTLSNGAVATTPVSCAVTCS